MELPNETRGTFLFRTHKSHCARIGDFFGLVFNNAGVGLQAHTKKSSREYFTTSTARRGEQWLKMILY